jgi:hypothetical protein
MMLANFGKKCTLPNSRWRIGEYTTTEASRENGTTCR